MKRDRKFILKDDKIYMLTEGSHCYQCKYSKHEIREVYSMNLLVGGAKNVSNDILSNLSKNDLKQLKTIKDLNYKKEM